MFLMHLWRDHKLFAKLFTLTCVGSSTGWWYYQISRTKHILENALDTTVLQTMDNSIAITTLEESIVEIEPFLEVDRVGFIQWSLDSFKFSYARRLLSITKDSCKYYRLKAINKLARMHSLDDWHYALIANMVDPRTAVALARTSHVDPRLFLGPPYRYHNFNNAQLINAMSTFLINVYEKSEHPCVGYFLSKVFVYEEGSGHIVDDDSSSLELSKFIQSEKEILPMCLESLLHHCSIEEYSKDIADLNGLTLLMEIHRRYADDINVTVKLCQILSYMSVNKNLLEPIFKSGWIGVLASWARHGDIRISIPAARALANLDDDSEGQYSSSLYVLHPVNRTTECRNIDVIFVHGLLGGVFFTWRQRVKNPVALGLLAQKPAKKKKPKGFIEKMKERMVGEEYEMVWSDIPVKADKNCTGPFTCPEDVFNFGKDVDDDSYTNCWPKDWLGKDCKNIRIIGINYETSISMWSPLCPLEKEKLTLNERSDAIAHELLMSDVGKRPIVWITHSMGGLIVKNILSTAYESKNPALRAICLNTKGVVFYSTPHKGSKMANLSNAISLVLWPSVEVQELKENSPRLKAIHEKFLHIATTIPMRVVTFVETKSTVVSAMKFNFLLVEPKSGNTGIGEYYEIPQDHLGICKPRNKQSFLYQKVLSLLLEISKKHGASTGNE